MYDTRDWVKFALDLPMRDQPGTHVRYCTAGVMLLGQVVSKRLRAGAGRLRADLALRAAGHPR